MLICLFLRCKIILKFIVLNDTVFLEIYQLSLLDLESLLFLLKSSLKGSNSNLLLIQLLLRFIIFINCFFNQLLICISFYRKVLIHILNFIDQIFRFLNLLLKLIVSLIQLKLIPFQIILQLDFTLIQHLSFIPKLTTLLYKLIILLIKQLQIQL